ncbi:MAG: hypothetical protein ING86_03645, partial [Methylobacterium sp.]|nr:hypothetical protein [Methylobacterium sp.]
MVRFKRLSPSKSLLSVLFAGSMSLFGLATALSQSLPPPAAPAALPSVSKKVELLPVTEIELMANSQPSALALDARD